MSFLISPTQQKYFGVQWQLQVVGDVEAMHLVWSRPSTIHHREARTKIWRSMVGLMESFSKTSHHKVHLGALDTFQGHGYMACISICCIVDGVPWLEVMDSALEATAVPIKVWTSQDCCDKVFHQVYTLGFGDVRSCANSCPSGDGSILKEKGDLLFVGWFRYYVYKLLEEEAASQSAPNKSTFLQDSNCLNPNLKCKCLCL